MSTDYRFGKSARMNGWNVNVTWLAPGLGAIIYVPGVSEGHGFDQETFQYDVEKPEEAADEAAVVYTIHDIAAGE